MNQRALRPAWVIGRSLIVVLALGLTGCESLKQLTSTTPTDASAPPASPQILSDSSASTPPVSTGDSSQRSEPRVIQVSSTGVDQLTPEAAEILKEHGYDVSQATTPKAVSPKEVEALTGPLKSGGETAQPPPEDFDPFASQDQVVEEYDPWEKFNVLAFEFNYKFDKYLLKPVAKGYNYIMPDPVQLGIANFFQNIRFVPRMLNNVFQAKFKGAGIEGSRFLINTTLGIGGLFDPAKNWFKLETPVEDTGQTLGSYGVKPGPYLVVPLVGVFTVRDGLGYIADIFLDPFNWFVLPIIKLNGAPKLVTHNDTITFAQMGMRAGIIINERSLNLEKFQGVEESTLDLYTAVRNAYLQQRARLIRE